MVRESGGLMLFVSCTYHNNGLYIRLPRTSGLLLSMMNRLPQTAGVENYFNSHRRRTYGVDGRQLSSLRCVQVQLFSQGKDDVWRLKHQLVL